MSNPSFPSWFLYRALAIKILEDTLNGVEDGAFDPDPWCSIRSSRIELSVTTTYCLLLVPVETSLAATCFEWKTKKQVSSSSSAMPFQHFDIKVANQNK